jgi:sulfur-carrier protein
VIQITVKLFAHYRDNRFKEQSRSYNDGFCIQDILDELAIDENLLPVGILLINGKQSQREDKPQDGDTVSIFPKVGGG